MRSTTSAPAAARTALSRAFGRVSLAALLLFSVACGSSSTSDPWLPTYSAGSNGSGNPGQDPNPADYEPYGPVDITPWFQGDWQIASEPTPIPPVREAVMLNGYPTTVPQSLRVLERPLYRPSASSRALVADEDRLYIVDVANQALVVMTRATGAIERRISFDSRPHHVVVGADGTAYVSLRHGAAIARIAPDALEATLHPVGTEPRGMALSLDGRMLAVVLRGDGALAILDASTMAELERRDGLDRPNVVAWNVLDTLHVGGRSSWAMEFSINRVASDEPLADLDLTERGAPVLRGSNPMDNSLLFARADMLKSNRVAAVTVDPESDRVFLAHLLSQPGDENDTLLAHNLVDTPNQQPNDEEPPSDEPPNNKYGSVQVPAEVGFLARPIELSVTALRPWSAGGNAGTVNDLPVRDQRTGEPLTSLLVQPSDINHHPTASALFVTGYGSDNVLILNSYPSDPMSSPVGIIQVGQAPAAITFSPDGHLAYVLNAHDFTISAIDLSGMRLLPVPFRLAPSFEVSFGSDPLPEDARLGRRVFTYAFNDNISQDNHFTCRSCHTDDTEDGLVWFTADGPRQTPSLAGRLADTGPFNWLGTESELKNNMRQTIDRMGGEGLEEPELVSLEKFLLVGLVPPPNPYAGKELTDEQLRGQALFYRPDVACYTCHTGESQTDGKLHDVGTTSAIEYTIAKERAERTGEPLVLPKFNTPSLRDLHATAPYLHDGSAETLYDVLLRTAKTMGRTDHLTPAELNDLVAYLLTL